MDDKNKDISQEFSQDIDPDISNNASIKSKSPTGPNKALIYSGGGIFILLVILVMYFFVLKGGTSDSDINTDEHSLDLKQKELELKDKELKLKEKELQSQKQNSLQNENISRESPEPVLQIQNWINALGNGDLRSAYNLMAANIRPDYQKFSSSKGYGGITSTRIFSCELESTKNCSYEVIADYESMDPSNKNGRYNQKFFINNCTGKWEIIKIQNISINFYN